ncbi:MAG: cytochrome c1 [Burkholderiales bacterium]|jgi:ubiquinol-cytochrome c reductase cytochrome c1 subunit
MKLRIPFVSSIASAALALGLLASPVAVQAAGGEVPLDRFPTAKLNDPAALQNGARLFVNYCLNCHSAQLMRYNRLQDIGLTEQQIKDNLLFTGNKVGDTMKIAMAPEDAKTWFGALPPDLSVTARARASHAGSGADWLYSYLRGYYRDNTRATGWNNAVFANVGMPHVLWELQGTRGATIEEVKRADGGFVKTVINFDTQGNRSEKSEKITSGYPHESSQIKLTAASGGKMSQAEYDGQIADLVAYLTYMADPSARSRVKLGVGVLIFLLFFSVFAWWLNREYWKDIK